MRFDHGRIGDWPSATIDAKLTIERVASAASNSTVYRRIHRSGGLVSRGDTRGVAPPTFGPGAVTITSRNIDDLVAANPTPPAPNFADRIGDFFGINFGRGGPGSKPCAEAQDESTYAAARLPIEPISFRCQTSSGSETSNAVSICSARLDLEDDALFTFQVEFWDRDNPGRDVFTGPSTAANNMIVVGDFVSDSAVAP